MEIKADYLNVEKLEALSRKLMERKQKQQEAEQGDKLHEVEYRIDLDALLFILQHDNELKLKDGRRYRINSGIIMQEVQAAGLGLDGPDKVYLGVKVAADSITVSKAGKSRLLVPLIKEWVPNN